MTDPERTLLEAVSAERLMAYTRGVSRWVRLSGSPEEAKAFDYVEETLRGFGLAVERAQHDALVSWPGPASVEVDGETLECITHSFAAPTPAEGIEGALADVGAGDPAPARGAIALVDGLATPARAHALERAGVAAAVFVNPPELHEMIVSTVWGAPTPETLEALPRLVCVSVRRDVGERLRANAGKRVRVRAQVDARWRPIPLLTADLPGRDESRFVLFSGHVDSWHLGAMDNGSANAVMLELARLFARRRRQLRRGVRFAFWSGHSHGRYAGSTWYADTHWLDLHRNAVLHLNVDSPGGRGATVLDDAETMAETWALAAEAVRTVSGQDLRRRRIGRLGDQSFWGVGLPSLFVGVSAQPADASATASALASLGGGQPASGGLGWWWHTPDDTLDKLDPDFLRRDAQVCALVLWRWCTSPVLPLNYRATAAELREVLTQLGDAFDLAPALTALDAFEAAVARLHDAASRARGRRRIAAIDDALVAISRALVPVNYTATGPFDHDRALPVAPLPGLQAAARLRDLTPGTDAWHALHTHLLRERNRLVHALDQARLAAERAL